MAAKHKTKSTETDTDSRTLTSTLTRPVYEELRRLLVENTGIELGDNKYSLVESRLLKRLNALQLSSFAKYLKLLKSSSEEFDFFINCMTTNKTDWFREPRHFDYLVEKVLPAITTEKQNERKAARNKDSDQIVYVWSAASSTGEEIYSLAMTLEENLPKRTGFRILGTDIDSEVLQKASAASYKKSTVDRQVPPHLRMKYFLNTSRSEISVCQKLRDKTKFRQFNLIESQMPVEMLFDVIFLRNVLIYFTRPTIEVVIKRLLRNLKPGGYLFIGHSESLNGLSLPLEQVSEAVYQFRG